MVTNDKMQRFKHHTEQQVYHSSKDTQQVDMRNGFNIQTEYANCLIQTVGESPVVHHNSVFPSFSSVHSTGRLLSLCFIQVQKNRYRMNMCPEVNSVEVVPMVFLQQRVQRPNRPFGTRRNQSISRECESHFSGLGNWTM